ncbi:MAG: alpha/beta fold hydrolase [Pseudomonadota bacterium]
MKNALRQRPWLAFVLPLLFLYGCATAPETGPDYLTPGNAIPAARYDVSIRTHDGLQLRATVFQPALAPGQDAPLVLHAHGFGVFRMSGPNSIYGLGVFSGKAALEAWRQGFWVISYDQRGHGDSEGMNRLMDPEGEVRDVSSVIDWSLAQLKRISRDRAGDPRIGMIGESYGGGAMLLAGSQDERIDALIPVTTWHDFYASLSPNQVPKSGWLTTLLLGDNLLNPGTVDPMINDAYWKARDGILEPAMVDYLKVRSPATRCANGQISHADTLLIQGFRDVAFPLNEAIANRECLQRSGSDVRLIGTQGGHLLPFTQWSWVYPGYAVEDKVHCGAATLDLVTAAVDWFDEKLRDIPGKAANIPPICLSQSYERGIQVDQIQKGGHPFRFGRTAIHSGFTGFFEVPLWPLERMAGLFLPRAHPQPVSVPQESTGTLRPAFTPVYVAKQAQELVGIPLLDGQVASSVDDPMLFAGVAVKRSRGRYYELLNDQVTPLRGNGRHQVEMMAVSTHLEAGDVVGIWLFGYHNQYRFSHTGWFMDAAIEGTIALPLLNLAASTGPAPAVD